jgi:alpha-amylase
LFSYKPGRIQVLLSQESIAYGVPVRIDKGITLSEGSDTIEISYRLSQLPKDYRMHFAVELNFAGMSGGERRQITASSKSKT